MLLATLLLMQAADRVHIDKETGQITLAGRNAVLREHSDPSGFDVITDMVEYRGRLLASACYSFDGGDMLSPWAYSHAAQVLEFDPATNAWSVLQDFKVSMFLNLRVVGDRLMAPEFHPFEERSRLVHTYDGTTWSTLGLLPRQNWHVMDVIAWKDKLYVSGSWRDEDPRAPKNDPGWWPGYGRVFESGDAGATWKEIRRTKENGRVLDMVVFDGALWANERGEHLIRWDGSRWEEVPVRLGKTQVDAKLGSAHLRVFAGKIVAINSNLVYTFDGKTWNSATPGFIDLWEEDGTLLGLRDDGTVWTTRDAAKWTKLTKEGVPAREFERQAQKGRPLHRGSVALHRGRLFVGTGAEGKIYAAPYEERGSWTSDPRRLPDGGRSVLSWTAAGTAKLKWRTADDAPRVLKASWKEVASGETPLDWPKGHAWIQFRADLESDGSSTPVVSAPALRSSP